MAVGIGILLLIIAVLVVAGVVLGVYGTGGFRWLHSGDDDDDERRGASARERGPHLYG